MKTLRSVRWELAVFLMDYHSGQWSRGYRLLCKLHPENFSESLCGECPRSPRVRDGETGRHLC